MFYLFIFAMGVVMRAYFRALAAACESEGNHPIYYISFSLMLFLPAAAQTLAGVSIIALALYTGV